MARKNANKSTVVSATAQDLGPIKFPKAIDFYKVNLEKKVVDKQPEIVVAPVVVKHVTKADKARVVLNESYADLNAVPQRKDIIARLVKEADLTPAGAATYLQNYKSKNNLTQKALAEKAAAIPA